MSTKNESTLFKATRGECIKIILFECNKFITQHVELYTASFHQKPGVNQSKNRCVHIYMYISMEQNSFGPLGDA